MDGPVYNGPRKQIDPPQGIFRVSGLGDMTIGAQAWLAIHPRRTAATCRERTAQYAYWH